MQGRAEPRETREDSNGCLVPRARRRLQNQGLGMAGLIMLVEGSMAIYDLLMATSYFELHLQAGGAP